MKMRRSSWQHSNKQLIFVCEEDAVHGKAAQVERGTGASEGRLSAPVSIATVQKIIKLGVPNCTDWVGRKCLG